MDNPTPKEVAIKEVNLRIVTKEQAKENFSKWIDKATINSIHTKDVIDFWKQVKIEINKL